MGLEASVTFRHMSVISTSSSEMHIDQGGKAELKHPIESFAAAYHAILIRRRICRRTQWKGRQYVVLGVE